MDDNKLKYDKPKGEFVDYLDRYTLTRIRSGYVTCKNVLMPEYFTKFGDSIRELHVRPDDVWLCSFPKSGTTWAQEMVWCIAHDVNFESANTNHFSRFPFIELSSLLDFSDVQSRFPQITFPEFVTDSVGHVSRLPSPRFIKSHLPFKLLPEKLQRWQSRPKLVYITRNPRDVCISYFHHCKLLEGYHGGFQEFCDLFLDENVNYAPYWDHIKGFWEQRNQPNMLILKYEDMKKNLEAVIRKTANFLGKTLDADQIAKLLEHLSFDSMKKNPAVNFEPTIELFRQCEMSTGVGKIIRSGELKQWKRDMSPELIERFRKWERQNLADAPFLAEIVDIEIVA